MKKYLSSTYMYFRVLAFLILCIGSDHTKANDWIEDFDLPDYTTIDDGITAWTSSTTTGAAEVRLQQFVANATGSPGAVWRSELITIIDAVVNISIDVNCSQTDVFESSDNYTVAYIIDGGSSVEIFNKSGEFSPQTVTANGITGTTLQIVVTMKNSGDDEYYYLDNVMVSGLVPVPEYYLTTNVIGKGTVEPSGGLFDSLSIVDLTALPANGWTISAWTGVDNNSGNSASVCMTSNRDVTVTFDTVMVSDKDSIIIIQENELGFVNVDGLIESEHLGFTGAGYANTDNMMGKGINYSVDVLNAGIFIIEFRYAANTNRSANIIQNDTIINSHTFLSTGSFTTWETATIIANLQEGRSNLRIEASGGDGLPNIDYIKITGAGITVTAPQFKLSVNIIPADSTGSVELSPDYGTYEQGTQVMLTAVNKGNYVFSHWSGDCSGSSTTVSLTMNEDKSVNAVFVDPADTTNTDCIFSLVGFATMGNGTTGGLGGPEVVVSTGVELQTEINKGGPRIIYVNGTITPANSADFSEILISNKSDISIFGQGTSGELDGIGILINNGATNIIIRNLSIHHVLLGAKDCIGIDGTGDGVSNIWIDHCELYHQRQGVSKDYYDGLFDTKRKAKNITFSWNYVHDGHKSMLIGYSDSDNAERSHTFHHNFFYNLNSRVPSVRYNIAHVFNNYFLDCSQGSNSRMGACLRIEKNYYENTNDVVGSWSSNIDGEWQLIDNFFVNSSSPPISDCWFIPPYVYASVLHESIDVKSVVMQNAGVGVLSNPADFDLCNESGFQTLTVNSGKGDGQYKAGTIIAIEADIPPVNMTFDAWTGDTDNIEDINSATTSITMPAKNIIVEATYKNATNVEDWASENNKPVIYPNPATSSFVIDLKNTGISTIEIFDLFGKLLSHVQTQNSKVSYDNPDLKQGIYFVKITDRNHNSFVQKLLLQ